MICCGTSKVMQNSHYVLLNCNPFTLGHRYLIEYAYLRVDYLYIFVVEENRSYFTFDDRFDLVCKGTADLKNVRVLPSGNFIISDYSFQSIALFWHCMRIEISLCNYYKD